MEDKELNKSPLDKENADDQEIKKTDLESKESELVKNNALEETPKDVTDTEKDDEKVADEEESEAVEETKEEESSEKTEKVKANASVEEDKPHITPVDLGNLSKEQLLNRLQLITELGEIHEVRSEVDQIKDKLFEIHNSEVETLKAKFIADGGVEEDFKPAPDPAIDQMHYFINKFRARRVDHAKHMEQEKENNLKIKYEVIEEIKTLAQNPESLNKTFHTFHDLQEKWKSTGPVPRSSMKDLYESYHLQVEIFYDYIKINKELRDYDLKKNMEKKLELCEKAEALSPEENEIKAFHELQELHKEWRETGPVAKEHKEPLWERFKAATSVINDKHQKYYEEQRKVQKVNLDKKVALCERVEAIAEKDIKTPKDWNSTADEVLKIQQEWRTVGFAPKKNNSKIYDRFRKACDKFFEKKRQFYSGYKHQQEDNLENKKALIEKAESMKDRDDWKEATEDFIQIQKDWKKIGPVPRKFSDSLWKKFRDACDYFFEQKNKFYHKIDDTQEENLKLKQAIIEKVKAFELGDDLKSNIKTLNDFKHEWSEIGHVPFKQKDSIYNEFRNIINKLFDQLNLEETDREIVKFRSKLDDISQTRNSENKLYSERNKLFLKLRALESDVAVWENNLGFFSNSKDSASLIKDFEYKIEKAKERIQTIARKIELIDKMDQR